MNKIEWIAAAAAKLKPYFEGEEGDRHQGQTSADYAESLYQTYVEEDSDDEWANDPEGAVAVDMSYWGD